VPISSRLNRIVSMQKTQVTRAPGEGDDRKTRWIDDQPLTDGQAVALGGAEAGSVTEAISQPRIEPDGEDLVLSDARMPSERDGFALAQWVRTNRPSMHVILTSGDARPSKAAPANIAGAMWQRIKERIEAL
jgi:DNA-binding NtrC family response regulator